MLAGLIRKRAPVRRDLAEERGKRVVYMGFIKLRSSGIKTEMSLSEAGTGLLDTHVTWSDVQKEMQKCLKTDAFFGEEKTVTRIGEDSGFVSKMALIHADWEDGTNELPEKFLVKIVTPLSGVARTEVNESVSKMYRNIHNIEVNSYKILEKYGEKKITIPKIFCSIPFSDDNLAKGFIIMEYLDNLDFRHFCDDLSYEQIKQVIPSLITIQSITPRLSQEELQKFPKNIFQNIYKPFFNKEMMSGHINELSTIENGYFADLKEDLSILSGEIFDTEYLKGLDELSDSLGIEPVLQHGDIWAANLLWRKDDSLAAIIDFQILTPSSCAMDILKLLLHMEGEARRLLYKDILQEYYEAAKEAFGDKIPYTYEQLLLSYEKLLPMISMILTFGTRAYLKIARQHRDEQVVVAMLKKTRMILEDALKMNKK